ncbi:hypothetical protein RJ55_00323 [Drechmeria coniospora]|nr:hypothetical protein RJ55_00323 [Drechmeria coniospora]
MEPIVYDETPLADYLKDGGEEPDGTWAPVDSSPRRPTSLSSASASSASVCSPPATPSPFAPTGRPQVRSRFRNNKEESAPEETEAPPSTLRRIRKSCSAAVVASIDRADSARFLEKFRYTIVASQLLNGHSVLGLRPADPVPGSATATGKDRPLLSAQGVVASIFGALAVAVAVAISWIRGSVRTYLTRKRLALLVFVLASSGILGQFYAKRQWLRYRREQSLAEISDFISNSHDIDGAIEAALSLVQEVELVSRGHLPLPPISRLEDRSQNRKCVRLRRALRAASRDLLESHKQALNVVKAFSEQTELEKYYDMYDISDFDISDALQGFNREEFEDGESLRTLKILVARLHTTRKMLLCALLALDANGEGNDLLRWTSAVEALRSANGSTTASCDKLQSILREEESFPLPPTPKGPATPRSQRWRSQLQKLNSLSTGIRGLQAKLHLLREESDRALNDSHDISELGPSLMQQYESIGADLKELMTAWEGGRTALALGIDRNEKRISSMSMAMSPTCSLSGVTTVGEGDAAAALKALTGESSPILEPAEAETTEVFEAVALPRPRSLFTREERIVRRKEEMEQKVQARQQMEATQGMLRELETVIHLRPKMRASPPVPDVEQITSA